MSASKRQKKEARTTHQTTACTGAGPLYFYEDEIFRVHKSGEVEFGTVTENWEMYSSESEQDDEDHESDKVPKGHVSVTWHPSGKEAVVPESKVKLSDRSLMPGDVVRRLVSGKDTQRGYARNVKVRSVVQTIGSKDVFVNVLASSLTPVQKFPSDVAVYMDSWIGSVRDMRYNLTLRFNDKSVCVVDSYTIAEYFEDARPSACGFRNGDIFYPGQKLQGSIRYLRNADWIYLSEDLKRAKDRKLVTGIVTRVECVGVNVQWQYPTGISPLEEVEWRQKQRTQMEKIVPKDSEPKDEKTGGEEAEKKNDSEWDKATELEQWDGATELERKKPMDFVTGEDMKRLKTLNMFDSCTVQLGDVSFYSPLPHETPIDKKTWKKEKNAHLLRSILNEQAPVPVKVNEEDYTSTDNEADDITGSDKNKLDRQVTIRTEAVTGSSTGKKSVPKVSTRSLRKKKLRKARQAATVTDVMSQETQLVVETIHTSSTADIVWQDGSVETGMRSIDLYPIHHLDDHEFFPGDFIVRADSTDPNTYGVVQNMDHSGRVANVKWFQAYTTGGDSPKELSVEEVSVYDIKDHPDFRFRPGTVVFRIANFQPNQVAGGQVLDNYPDGKIRVWWANNVEHHCWPQDLYRIGDYDSDEGELWDIGNEDEAGSDDSWETDDEEDEEKNESPSRKKNSPSRKSSDKLQDADGSLACVNEALPKLDAQFASSSQAEDDATPTVSSTSDIASIVANEPIPQFSILSTVPPAHRFFSTTFQPANSRNFLKTIQKEMGLLRNNLPVGILVKGYENRMDLYSVMVHGPKNTPYEDGIFLFDIQLPATYPDSPPVVHYVSFCQSRLNPNLYECGKVCVSLLGTWSGKGNETWTSESSLLQLLISIQGLILVPEPYFNEAGYERQRGSQQGDENSRMYNEMVLIKLVQSMTRMLAHPHAPWASEIVQHIESSGPRMINRYKGWLSISDKSDLLHVNGGDFNVKRKALHEEGSMLNGDGEDPGFPLFPVSKGFSITLKKTLETFSKACSRTSSATNVSSTSSSQMHVTKSPGTPSSTSVPVSNSPA